MNVQVLSDLHLEFEPFEFKNADADVVVLAGDIHLGCEGIKWAKKNIPVPVIYVLGNHEYYRHTFPALIDEAKKEALGSSVHVLEEDICEIDNVVFLGCTLWTDFALHRNVLLAQIQALRSMADYRQIKRSSNNRNLKVSDTTLAHAASLSWLKEQLKHYSNSNIVVVTHHGPSSQSLPEQYKTEILSAAFVSDLRSIVEESSAKCWIHGHLHSPFDYQLGNTRVLCNPKGYPSENNQGFDPTLCLDV